MNEQMSAGTFQGSIDCAWVEGSDFRGFVEHGARNLRREDELELEQGIGKLRVKIRELGWRDRRLAEKLEFLADYFETREPLPKVSVNREVAFALLYAACELDLLPEDFQDDRAVVNAVLERNRVEFERFCAVHGGGDQGFWEPKDYLHSRI